MVMEAEAIVVWTEKCQADDRLLLGIDVEEAALRFDGDVGVVTETANRGGELLGPFGGGLLAD